MKRLAFGFSFRNIFRILWSSLLATSICVAIEKSDTENAGPLSEEFAKIQLKISEVQTYIAQMGDTMSSIALRFFEGSQLYGPGGRLELLLKLNPQIKNKNIIFPGDLVYLKPDALPNSSEEQKSEKINSVTQLNDAPLKTLPEIKAPEPVFSSTPQGHSFLNISTGGSFYRLDSLDLISRSSGSLLSSLSPFIKFGWEPQLHKNISVLLEFETAMIEWIKPSGREISNSKDNVSAAAIKLIHQAPFDSKISFLIQQEELLIPRAESTNLLRLEKINQTNIGAEFSKVLLNQQPFQVSGTLSAGWSSGARSGNLTVNSGTYFDLSLGVSQTFRKFQVHSEVLYLRKNFSTNFSDNENTQLQFLLGLRWKLEE